MAFSCSHSGEHDHLEHLSEAEGHNLRHTQAQALLKDNVEVDVHKLPSAAVQQNIVQMPVTQPQEPPNLQAQLRSMRATLLCSLLPFPEGHVHSAGWTLCEL